MRSLILLVICVQLAVAQGAANAQTPAVAERPNVVWLVSEDNSPYLGCYGDGLARTPVLDRLAKEGVRYTQARSAAPVCAPSRCSIVTGRFACALGTQNMRSRWEIPGDVRYLPELLREAGWYCTNNAKTDYNVGNDRIKQAWDESSAKAHWRNRPAGKPFYSVFNIETTHESRLHKRMALTTDPAKVRVPAYLPDLPAVREDIAQYYDRVAEMDTWIGQKLDELKAEGLLDSTIVVYYSDHGGAIPRGKRFLYNSGTVVPLIVHVPERFKQLAPQEPGTVCADQVSLLDMGLTTLSWCGVPLPKGAQGRAIAGPQRSPAPAVGFTFRERMDETYDSSRAVYDGRFVYIRNFMPHIPNGQHITYQWQAASMQAWADAFAAGKLTPVQAQFFKHKAAEELFDAKTDPDNVVNVAGDPAFAADLKRLREALQAKMLAIRDTGLLPEPLIATLRGEQPPMTYAADETRYPLGRLLELVNRMQVGGDAKAVAESLVDPMPAVRYWGATAAARLEQEPAGLRKLLADDNLAVRLAAADAVLFRSAKDPEAVAVVTAVLGSDVGGPVRMMAGSMVLRQPDQSLFPKIQPREDKPKAKGK